jgi:hypothetical protein
MDSNTQDLARLGFREIDQLADLLKVYAEAKWKGDNELGDGVRWEYNSMSDNLFLVDEYYRVAMVNEDGRLEMWNNCPECGNEGFASECPLNIDEGYCPQCEEKKKTGEVGSGATK